MLLYLKRRFGAERLCSPHFELFRISLKAYKPTQRELGFMNFMPEYQSHSAGIRLGSRSPSVNFIKGMVVVGPFRKQVHYGTFQLQRKRTADKS